MITCGAWGLGNSVGGSGGVGWFRWRSVNAGPQCALQGRGTLQIRICCEPCDHGLCGGFGSIGMLEGGVRTISRHVNASGAPVFLRVGKPLVSLLRHPPHSRNGEEEEGGGGQAGGQEVSALHGTASLPPPPTVPSQWMGTVAFCKRRRPVHAMTAWVALGFGKVASARWGAGTSNQPLQATCGDGGS